LPATIKNVVIFVVVVVVGGDSDGCDGAMCLTCQQNANYKARGQSHPVLKNMLFARSQRLVLKNFRRSWYISTEDQQRKLAA
jgi:hypothetical protein